MLVLLLLAEIDGASRWFLHACGVTFIGGRVAHALGMSRTSKASSGRFWGTAASWLVIAALAAWNIGAYLRMLPRFW
jgi:hypothetical protein